MEPPTEQAYSFMCVADPGAAPRCFHQKCTTKVVVGEPMLLMKVKVNWPLRCAGESFFNKHVCCVLPGMASDVLDFGLDEAMADVPLKLRAELKKQVENAAAGRKVTNKELQRLCRDGVAKPTPKEVKKPPKQTTKHVGKKKQKVADVPSEKVVVGSGPVRERASTTTHATLSVAPTGTASVSRSREEAAHDPEFPGPPVTKMKQCKLVAGGDSDWDSDDEMVPEMRDVKQVDEARGDEISDDWGDSD